MRFVTPCLWAGPPPNLVFLSTSTTPPWAGRFQKFSFSAGRRCDRLAHRKLALVIGPQLPFPQISRDPALLTPFEPTCFSRSGTHLSAEVLYFLSRTSFFCVRPPSVHTEESCPSFRSSEREPLLFVFETHFASSSSRTPPFSCTLFKVPPFSSH